MFGSSRSEAEKRGSVVVVAVMFYVWCHPKTFVLIGQKRGLSFLKCEYLIIYLYLISRAIVPHISKVIHVIHVLLSAK